MERVVVTGIGMLTPLGCDVDTTWKNILAGKSGITRIDRFDTSALSVQIAGLVKYGEDAFNPLDYVNAKDIKKMDIFILYAIAAAQQAILNANIKVGENVDAHDIGVTIGSGIGGLPGIYETSEILRSQGQRRVSPFFIPASLINLASGHVSIRHGLKGPNHAVVTACATGAHAIGDAMRMIQMGDAKIMVAGGTESAISPLGIAGFAAARTLASSYNDNPEKASRPFDEKREGFVMGEGAGIVVLEALSHAIQRNAHIYAEIVGYGMSGDAHHITSPHESGEGAFFAMKNALKKSGLSIQDIDYINAHGTSTPPGDRIEVFAVKRLFEDHAHKLCMSSTKSSIGHLLGAAGSVEAIFSILALRDQIAPPTINLDSPSNDCDLDLVPNVARPMKIGAVMSNSFGFGGTNATLIFKTFQ